MVLKKRGGSFELSIKPNFQQMKSVQTYHLIVLKKAQGTMLLGAFQY